MKKHDHSDDQNWMHCEIRGVYDGVLYRDCMHCSTREVWRPERYKRWIEEYHPEEPETVIYPNYTSDYKETNE